jgi:hypothetical protein
VSIVCRSVAGAGWSLRHHSAASQPLATVSDRRLAGLRLCHMLMRQQLNKRYAAFQRDRSISGLETFVFYQLCGATQERRRYCIPTASARTNLACWSTFEMVPRHAPLPVRYDDTTSTPVRDCRQPDQAPDAARVTGEQQKRGRLTGRSAPAGWTRSAAG